MTEEKLIVLNDELIKKSAMDTVPECEDGKKPDQTDMLIRAIRAASENGGGENGGD